MTHKFPLAGVMSAVLLVAASARAQAGESDAYEDMLKGLAAYDQQDYAQAARLLSEALVQYKLPTVAYYAGQAFEKQGKLLEATSLYRQAAALTPSGAGQDLLTQKEAQQRATEALSNVMERIPRLTLRVESEFPEAVTVMLDGSPVEAESLGQPQPVNPGVHELVGKCRERESSKPLTVTVAEGQNQELSLPIDCSAVAPAPVMSLPAEAAAAPRTPASSKPPEAPDRTLKSTAGTLGWVGVGVGGAAVALWGVTGLAALSKKGNLKDDDCADQNCDPDLRSRVDRYNALRDWSAVGFWVGVPLLAAGAGALWWSRTPDQESPNAPGMTAWVGLGEAGVLGKF